MNPSTGSGPRVRLRHRAIPGPPPDPVKARLLRLYRALQRRFGPQHWWPGRTPFEIAAGAVLTQHTAWTSAARAIAALRAARLLDARRLAGAGEDRLAEVIRPAGTYRLKARHLRALARWLLARSGGRWGPLRRAPLAPLRRELLGVAGLGPETADAILLYAAHRPVFVADAYTRRILVRHRLLPEGSTYEEARRFLESHLPSDPALFNEFHALLVAAAKDHCRVDPRCEACPLASDLRAAARPRGARRPTSRAARRDPPPAAPTRRRVPPGRPGRPGRSSAGPARSRPFSGRLARRRRGA